MYITIKSIKKTLGKYIEMTDLYMGIPMFIIFLVLFTLTDLKIESLIFLSVCAFLLIPINYSKKNRMYKVMILLFQYLFKVKTYYYSNEEVKENKFKILIKKLNIN